MSRPALWFALNTELGRVKPQRRRQPGPRCAVQPKGYMPGCEPSGEPVAHRSSRCRSTTCFALPIVLLSLDDLFRPIPLLRLGALVRKVTHVHRPCFCSGKTGLHGGFL